MIVVQWSDWIHVRREGKQSWEEKKTQRERENKHHTIRKLKNFEIHKLVSFYRKQSGPPV